MILFRIVRNTTIFLLLIFLHTCEQRGFVEIAAVKTGDSKDVLARSATLEAQVVDLGVGIEDHGHCWSTNQNPSINGNKSSLGAVTQEKAYISEIADLDPETTYYYRAYVLSNGVAIYGNSVSFTTLDGYASVNTSSVTNITSHTALCGGSVSDAGAAMITHIAGICWNTTGGPGSFTSTLTGLDPNTTYYVRAYATNSYGTEYGDQISFMTLIDPTIMDYDGNEYKVVDIGTQEWMAENLKVTHYPDGSDIPHVTGNSTWAGLGNNNTGDAYCWYNDDEATNKDKYGALYTYAAAKDACPTGWHLPTDEEWTELENYLIDKGYNWDGTTSGDKVGKSLAATSGWASSSEAGDIGNDQASNNSTGFSALPGGYRNGYYGSFYNAGNRGHWWSSTVYSSTSAYHRALYYYYAGLYRYNYSNSVRCLRD